MYELKFFAIYLAQHFCTSKLIIKYFPMLHSDSYIIDAILRTLTYARQWKVAEIHMILKLGKQAELPKSYRPISLLRILSKAMETVSLKRLCSIITCRQLVPNNQFDFRPLYN